MSEQTMMNTQSTIVDHQTIPMELAKELSELMTIEKIRERMLLQVIDDPEKYDIIEKKLIPVTARIEAIKTEITMNHIDEKYNSSCYMWNYNGYAVSENIIDIIYDPTKG